MLKKLFFLLIFVLPASAYPMTVTVEPGTMKSEDKGLKDNKQADLNLSGVIVRKVLWEDGAVMMPVTVSNDRSYNDVKLISRDLYRKMEDCFVNGCRESGTTDNPPMPVVRVEAIRKLNSKIRVSNIEISFDNAITVSVGIMAQNYPDGTFWLSYPQSIGFSTSRLQEYTDDVVFKAYAEENPHLDVVRAEKASSLSTAAAKAEEEEASAKAKEDEDSGMAIVNKTPVFEEDVRPTRKNKRSRSKKGTSTKKSRKKKSRSDSYDEASGIGSMYEAR